MWDGALTGPVVCLGEAMVEFRREGDLWRQGFAGDTLNVAWALRALAPAATEVDFATVVGTDAVSHALVRFVDGAGIGTDRFGRDPARTVGLYTIETDARGERSFAYWRGESAARRLSDRPGAAARRLAGAGLVYLSGVTAAIIGAAGRAHLLADLETLRAAGVRIAYDPNYRPRLWEADRAMQAFAPRIVALADLILPTFDDEAAAFGDRHPNDTVARLAGWGAREIAVKDGTAPCWLRRADGTEAQVAPPLARRAVDTTGAGDSFNGAYLAARLAGADPATAAAQAHRVAAAVVMTTGALLDADQIRAAAMGR